MPYLLVRHKVTDYEQWRSAFDAHSLTRQANGSHRSWRFTRVATAGNVIFSSAQNRLADAQAAGLTNISVLRSDDGGGKGMAVYRIDLGR